MTDTLSAIWPRKVCSIPILVTQHITTKTYNRRALTLQLQGYYKKKTSYSIRSKLCPLNSNATTSGLPFPFITLHYGSGAAAVKARGFLHPIIYDIIATPVVMKTLLFSALLIQPALRGALLSRPNKLAVSVPGNKGGPTGKTTKVVMRYFSWTST